MDTLHDADAAEPMIQRYFGRQEQLTENMVSLVIDWLLEVQVEWKLATETMYLAVNLMHRYLARVVIPKRRLQLVGTTALFIASKYEECQPPILDDFLYIADDTYTAAEFLEMERSILNTLDFRLSAPTVRTFLKRYCVVADFGSRQALMSGFLGELVLADPDIIRFRASTLAAVAVALSRLSTSPSADLTWDATMQHYTRHTLNDMAECAWGVWETWKTVTRPVARKGTTLTKYSRTAYHRVASVPPPPKALMAAFFGDQPVGWTGSFAEQMKAKL